MVASTLVNLVKVNVLSSGTGAFKLGSALLGYRGLEALVDGSVYSYSVQQQGLYEVGRGTYLAALGVLVRAPFFSSEGGSPVSFGSGFSVAFTFLAEDIVQLAGKLVSDDVALVQEVARATAVEALLAQRIVTGAAGLLSYATSSQMSSDNSRPIGQLGYVYGDTDPKNNSIYEYTSSGWTESLWFYRGLSLIVQPLVDQAQAAAHSVSTLIANADLGPQQLSVAKDATGMQVVVGAIDTTGDQLDALGTNLSATARQFRQVGADGALLMQDQSGLPMLVQDGDGGLVPIGEPVSLQRQLANLRGQARGGGENGRYRFFTFADVRDAQGNEAEYLMAFDGSDAAAFPSRKYVAINGMPAGTTVRDSCAFRDAAGIWWLTYSAHGFAVGPADAEFGIARSRDGADFTYVGAIPLPGMQEAWAPDWTIDALGRAHIIVATAPDANSAHVQRVLRAASPDMTSFTDIGPLTGAAVPADAIDTHVFYEDGFYVAIFKIESGGDHSLRMSWADTITGPYSVAVELAFIVGTVEGPTTLRLPDGRLRLFYDRVGGATAQAPLGVQYIDTFQPIGPGLVNASAWTAEKPLVAGTARHGSIVPY